ncbi:MAG: MFS transporter [Acidimicrobiales bacterium]
MAVGDRVDQFRALARQALEDLFDQRQPFGRLALVQVLMLAGDTLVTISLAGSLFFSISPHEAKSKVLLYLVLTLAPFAVVSPLLGPLIDRSRGARRAMAVLSATGRCALCPFMAADTHSLLLFPEAFLILVLSKLYLVTRGALVPEMAASGSLWLAGRDRGAGDRGAGDRGAKDRGAGDRGAGRGSDRGQGPIPAAGPADPNIAREESGSGSGPPVARAEYATLNARLTLLGTLSGFVASVPGIILLKLAGAPGVLVFDSFVFAAAAIAGLRLPIARSHRLPGRPSAEGPVRGSRTAGAVERPAAGAHRIEGAWARHGSGEDMRGLQPIAHPEVIFGLTTMSLIRGLAAFLVFMLAFGLRRENAALWWYGLALGASGAGSLSGLLLVARLRRRLVEQQILLAAVWLIAVAAAGAAMWGTLVAQAGLALCVGVAGALGQPSFDAIAQRFVPPPAQGRAFARFATRQQLVWVLGALIPVVVAFPFPDGDVVMASVAAAGGLFYLSSRRAVRHRAVPRGHRPAGE